MKHLILTLLLSTIVSPSRLDTFCMVELHDANTFTAPKPDLKNVKKDKSETKPDNQEPKKSIALSSPATLPEKPKDLKQE